MASLATNRMEASAHIAPALLSFGDVGAHGAGPKNRF